LLFVLSLLFLTACDSSGTAEDEVESGPVELLHAWEEADPSDVGMDADVLHGAFLAAAGIDRLKSLLVVKDGKLVMEHYLHGATSDDLFDVRSVTKSVVSTVVGIAIDEGKIPGVDTPIGNNLDFLSENMPEAIRSITVRNLLMMAGGWEGDGSINASYSRWVNSGNTEAFLIDKPRVNDPGIVHSYSSSSVHLLSVLAAQFLEQPFASYTDTRLLSQLGIVEREWEIFDSGYPNGGAGLDLKARDLAKIGQLFLQRGMSGNRQIVSEEWVDEASSPKFGFSFNWAGLTNVSYGYLWWTDETDGISSYFAWGFGGQFIYVSPARNLVAVVTTDYDGVYQAIGGENAIATAAMGVISNHVLPAVE